MSTAIHYIKMGGGLDNTSSPVQSKDGRLVACENFEEVFGLQGYRRIYGYERYDGQIQPSEATYYSFTFDTGVSEIVAGDLLDASASLGGYATVVSVTLTSGTWAGGDAAGTLVVYALQVAFADGSVMKVGGVTKATASSASVLGVFTDPEYSTRQALTIAAARAAIDPVPGSGPILGAALFDGRVFAARNAADGLTAALYASFDTGWGAVRSGLIPGGNWKMQAANFTGTTSTMALYGVDGRNNPFYVAPNGSSYTYTKITGVWESNATSTTSATIGSGAFSFVVVEADRNYTVGEEVMIYDAATTANSMRALVTAWTPGTKTLDVLAVTYTGSGTKTAWDIGRVPYSSTGIYTDKPYLLAAHKNHLFLAYPYGQLQTSDLGEPTTYTTTAALFGTGEEMTNLLTLKSDNLAVYCENSIHIISGTSQLDWQKDVYSATGGAIADTAVEVAGVAVHLDHPGIKSLQATQAYGNYETSTFSGDVSITLNALRPTLIGAIGNRTSQQYRLYSSTGDVLVGTVMTPAAAITQKDVSFTPSKYLHGISCVASGELSDGSEIVLFGTTDGYVMREGVGTSFDGEPIISSLKLPFFSYKTPSRKKRFRKIAVEVLTDEALTVMFKQHFDNLDGNYPTSENLLAPTVAANGFWDVAAWDLFTWTSNSSQGQSEVNVMGIGRNMALLFWHESATDSPFTLQGAVVHYSLLGTVR